MPSNLLLDFAEKLFAERGIDAVSLNSIVQHANQQNASVMQYYFGSKAGLIEAILRCRMEELNKRRSELIASVDTSDRMAALRQIAEAMVLPFGTTCPSKGEAGIFASSRKLHSMLTKAFLR